MSTVKTLYKMEGGGTRSERAPAYHLVPPQGFRRTALRFAHGAEVHGEFNWMQSTSTEADAAKWAKECYNHMMEHALKMANNVDPHDDHLGAIGWAQTVLCYIEERYGKRWTDLGVEVALKER